MLCVLYFPSEDGTSLKDELYIFQVKTEHLFKGQTLYFPSEDGTSFKGQTLYFLSEDGTYFNLKCDRTFKKKKKWSRHRNSVYKISVTHYNTHRRV